MNHARAIAFRSQVSGLILLLSAFILQPLSLSSAASLTISLTEWGAPIPYATNRSCLLTPLSVSAANALAIYDQWPFTTDTNGAYTVTNILSGWYQLEVMAPPHRSTYTLYVDPTNAQQSALACVQTNETWPDGQYAYPAAVSDARYASSSWTATRSTLLAATASHQYQEISPKYNSFMVPTNALVLWPDGTYGVWTATNINSTWLTVDGYTITYTNTGETIAQPSVLRDAWGNVTNSPALVIAP